MTEIDPDRTAKEVLQREEAEALQGADNADRRLREYALSKVLSLSSPLIFFNASDLVGFAQAIEAYLRDGTVGETK
jgi:hypothetical protein